MQLIAHHPREFGLEITATQLWRRQQEEVSGLIATEAGDGFLFRVSPAEEKQQRDAHQQRGQRSDTRADEQGRRMEA